MDVGIDMDDLEGDIDVGIEVDFDNEPDMDVANEPDNCIPINKTKNDKCFSECDQNSNKSHTLHLMRSHMFRWMIMR